MRPTQSTWKLQEESNGSKYVELGSRIKNFAFMSCVRVVVGEVRLARLG